MTGRLAFLVLAFMLVAPLARAEPIPIERLKQDFEQCVPSCPAEWGEPACTNYCRCMNSGVQRDFTYEEYQELVRGFSTEEVASSVLVGRFLAIRDNCAAAVPQLSQPQ